MFFALVNLLLLLSVHFFFSYWEVRGGLLWTWWWTPKKNRSCLTDPIRCPRDLFTTVCIHWASTSTFLYDAFLFKISWLLTFVTRNGYGVLDQKRLFQMGLGFANCGNKERWMHCEIGPLGLPKTGWRRPSWKKLKGLGICNLVKVIEWSRCACSSS